MQVLFDLEPTYRFNAILSVIDIHQILDVVMKKSRFGPRQSLNYSAMIYSLIIRITERIPFIKDFVKRLATDLRFKVDCGFLVSDEVPSEASYSRMIKLISESNALDIVQERLLIQAITKGFYQMKQLRLMQPMLKREIMHHTNPIKKKENLKNADVKRKKNVSNG